MLQQISDLLTRDLGNRTREKMIGGNLSLNFKDLRDFCMKVAKVFGFEGHYDTKKVIETIKNNRGSDQKIQQVFQEVTGKSLSTNKIIEELESFLFVINQVIQDNYKIYQKLNKKTQKLIYKMQDIAKMYNETEIKDIFDSLIEDFQRLIQLQQFISQKLFKYTAPQHSKTVYSDKKFLDIINAVMQLDHMLKNMSLSNEKIFMTKYKKIKHIINDIDDPQRLYKIQEVLPKLYLTFQSDYYEIKDIVPYFQKIFVFLLREKDQQKREQILEKLNSVVNKMVKGKTEEFQAKRYGGSSRQNSLKTRISNQLYVKKQKTILFKSTINSMYVKIVQHMYETIKDKNLQEIKKYSQDIRTLIDTIIEVFKLLLGDNSKTVYEIVNRLQTQKGDGDTAKIGAMAYMNRSIGTLQVVQKGITYKPLVEILDNIIRIMQDLKKYIKRVSGEIVDDNGSDIEEMSNREEMMGGSAYETELKEIYKTYFETTEMLELLYNVWLISVITKNIDRAKREVKGISDNKYFEDIALNKLKLAQDQLDEYFKQLDKIRPTKSDQEYCSQWIQYFNDFFTDDGSNGDNKPVIDRINDLFKHHSDNKQVQSFLEMLHKQNDELVKKEDSGKYSIVIKKSDDGNGSIQQKDVFDLIISIQNTPTICPNENSSKTYRMKKIFDDLVELKKEGYYKLIECAEVIEKYLNYCTNNLLDDKLKVKEIGSITKDLITESHDKTDNLLQIEPNETYMNFWFGLTEKKQDQNTGYKTKLFGGVTEIMSPLDGAQGNDKPCLCKYLELLENQIEKVKKHILESKAFNHFSRLFHLISSEAINNDDIMKLEPETIEMWLKLYAMSSSFEIDPFEIRPEKKNKSDGSVTESEVYFPGFLKILPAYQNQKDMQIFNSSFFIRYNLPQQAYTDVTKDLDYLYNAVIQGMTQKVLNMVGLYRIYAGKKIDLQLPRLLFGGDHKESSESGTPQKSKNMADISEKQWEQYYRTVLLCEYYADFFYKQEQIISDPEKEVILYIKPISGSDIGDLLTKFFQYKQKRGDQSIHYEADQMTTIINILNRIYNSPISKNIPIYDQIVEYINTQCGILTKKDYEQIAALPKDSESKGLGKQHLFYVEGDYHEFSDILQMKKRAQQKGQTNKNMDQSEIDQVSFKTIQKMLLETLEKMYDNIIKQQQTISVSKLFRQVKQQYQRVQNKSNNQKIEYLRQILNNKRSISMQLGNAVDIHENIIMPIQIICSLYKKASFCSNQYDKILKKIESQKEISPGKVNRRLIDLLFLISNGDLVSLHINNSKNGIEIGINTSNMTRSLSLIDDMIQYKIKQYGIEALKSNIKQDLRDAIDNISQVIKNIQKFYKSIDKVKLGGGTSKYQFVEPKDIGHTIHDIVKTINENLQDKESIHEVIRQLKKTSYEQADLSEQEIQETPQQNTDKLDKFIKEFQKDNQKKYIPKGFLLTGEDVDLESVEDYINKVKIKISKAVLKCDISPDQSEKIPVTQGGYVLIECKDLEEDKNDLQKQQNLEKICAYLADELFIKNSNETGGYSIYIEKNYPIYRCTIVQKNDALGCVSLDSFNSSDDIFEGLYDPKLKQIIEKRQYSGQSAPQLGKRIYKKRTQNVAGGYKKKGGYWNSDVEKYQQPQYRFYTGKTDYQFFQSMNIFKRDIYVFNDIVRRFIGGHLLRLSMNSKAYAALFAPIYKQQNETISQYAAWRDSDIPKMLQGVIYDGGRIDSSNFYIAYKHNNEQTSLRTVLFSSTLDFLYSLYVEKNSDPKENDWEKSRKLLDTLQQQDVTFFKSLMGTLLSTQIELKEFRKKIDFKIKLAEYSSQSVYDPNYLILQSLLQEIDVFTFSIDQFIQLQNTSLIPMYNIDVATDDLVAESTEKTGLLSHFTKIINGEDLNDRHYLSTLSKYFYQKLYQESQIAPTMLSQLIGIVQSETDIELLEKQIWYQICFQLQFRDSKLDKSALIQEDLYYQLYKYTSQKSIIGTTSADEYKYPLKMLFDLIIGDKKISKHFEIKFKDGHIDSAGFQNVKGLYDQNDGKEFTLPLDDKAREEMREIEQQEQYGKEEEEEDFQSRRKRMSGGTSTEGQEPGIELDFNIYIRHNDGKYRYQSQYDQYEKALYISVTGKTTGKITGATQIGVTVVKITPKQKELHNQDVCKLTFQSQNITVDQMILSRNQNLLDDLTNFVMGHKTTEVEMIYYNNMCDLGIIPFNFMMLKRDVSLLNILLNSSLYKISIQNYVNGANGTPVISLSDFIEGDGTISQISFDNNTNSPNTTMIYFKYLQSSVNKQTSMMSLKPLGLQTDPNSSKKDILYTKIDKMILDLWFNSEFMTLFILYYVLGGSRSQVDIGLPGERLNKQMEFVKDIIPIQKTAWN